MDLVDRMPVAKGHGGLYPHINDVINELEDENLRNRIDNSLEFRAEALAAIEPSDITPPQSLRTRIPRTHESHLTFLSREEC